MRHSERRVFLLLSGLAKVTLDTPEGREIVLSVLGAGDLLGEFEAVQGRSRRAAGNVAMLPLECRVFPGEQFMAALETRPRMLLARTPDGAAVDIGIHLTQEELASLMSTSRDSAVRALGTLRTRGLVATSRRQVVVADLDGLRRFASGFVD